MISGKGSVFNPGGAECARLDVLVFVEDPGAANFVAPLVGAMGERGAQCVVLASGLAAAILRRRSVPYREVAAEDSAESVLAEFTPRLVLVGTATNPDTFGLRLVAAARRRSVLSVGAVDASMNSALRFRGHTAEPLAYAPDWIFVPDQLVATSFIELGMPVDRVIACGNPHYDYVMDLGEKWQSEDRAKFRRRIFSKSSTGRKILLFAAEGSARVLAAPRERMATYSFLGRGNLSGRTEIALEELLDALPAVPPRPYVVLRAHPKDHCEDYAAYADEIDVISAGGDPLEIVFAADLVVGTTTMLVAEAALLGRATVAIIPVPEERHWLPSVVLGLTQVATTRADVPRVLREGLRSAVDERALVSLRGSKERAAIALARVLSNAGP